jgi:hypothetical protein
MASYRYQCLDCGKTHVGPQLPGRMTCNCAPAKLITGVRIVTPLTPELLETISSSEAATRRNAFCTRWGIDNKSHKQHGSNFSSNQTVVSLINDIVGPVTGELRNTVRAHVIRDFGYNIDSKEMNY